MSKTITHPLSYIMGLFYALASANAISAQAQSESDSMALKNPILKPTQTISVAAGVAGIIDSMLVSEGDEVSIGQSLVRVRCDEAILNREKAQFAFETASAKATRDVDVRLAKKSAEVAEQELARTLKANLLAADTYPPNEVDRYRLMFERSKIEVERYKLDQQLSLIAKKQSEVELKQTQQLIDRHLISSTAQAMVVSVEKHAGEWVDPSTKMLELMSINRLRVEGFVDANDALGIEKGASANVIVSVAKSPRSVSGRVTFVSPTANPANGQIRVYIEIENQGLQFRPGMAASATIPR